MARRDIKLIQSFVEYVEDVKPYRTKLRDFTSELFFEDKIRVALTEIYELRLNHQNVWGREHIGGFLLYNVGSGTEADRTFRLPATIWPRFSLTGNVTTQTPPGDDPAYVDLSDIHGYTS